MSSSFFLLLSLLIFLPLPSSLSILTSPFFIPPPSSSFCPFPSSSSEIPTPIFDKSSLSNPNEVRTLHFHLNLTLDFSSKTLTGSNTLSLISLLENLPEVHLDIRAMSIFKVQDQHQNLLKYVIEANPFDESIGQRLRIFLAAKIAKFELFKITIFYQTTENATALNWLAPEQTTSKTLPYLFSQCESIHCRTLAPLQDTPGVKATYSADMLVPADVSMFMSANLTRVVNASSTHRLFSFNCSVPIPSYLLAVIAGNLEQVQVGRRTFVISEPNDLPVYAKELSDLEVYLETVESYVTPYQWGEYKIVILPGSFPYGGMENPLLTFASPTIIAGDKSGVFVAIHEIGHSWTGNWVTCQNWEHFWLNEGFTVFLERKGGKILNGEENYKIASIVGNISLVEDFKAYGYDNSFSSLHPNLTVSNPDDAFSTVPYEKGFQFLVYLESLVGEDNFRSFLERYLQQFGQQSLIYEEMALFFIKFVQVTFDQTQQYLILNAIDWKGWVESPGCPPIDMAPFFKSKILDEALLLADTILTGHKPNNTNIFNAFDMNTKLLFLQYFLDRIEGVNMSVINFLNDNYALDNCTNAEILFVWLRINILKDNKRVFPIVEDFLARVGRMKFIRPLYLALATVDKSYTVRIFELNQNFYHQIAVRLIKKDLGIN